VWQQIRAVTAGVVGGLLILVYSFWIGTRDTQTLTVRALIAVVVVWVLAEILQTKTVRSRLPFIWVGFGSTGRKLAKESDEALGKRIDAVVSGISAITANYIRYQPVNAPGGDLTEWQRGVEERQRHERDACARIVDLHGSEILEIVSALRQRGAVDENQFRHLIWTLQMLQYGYLHDLQGVVAEMTGAGRRLRGLD